MSNMIECDGCKAKMYTDARSERGGYHSVWIDESYGYHLCRICYEAFMRNILRCKWSEDEQQWIPADEENRDQLNECPFRTDGSYWCDDCKNIDYESCSMFKQKRKARQDVIEMCRKEREQSENVDKLEKVIKGAERCITPRKCVGCPYEEFADGSDISGCLNKLHKDLLELLKEHKEHEELLAKLGYHWTGKGETLALCSKGR